jgi:hypothetical protein
VLVSLPIKRANDTTGTVTKVPFVTPGNTWLSWRVSNLLGGTRSVIGSSVKIISAQAARVKSAVIAAV